MRGDDEARELGELAVVDGGSAQEAPPELAREIDAAGREPVHDDQIQVGNRRASCGLGRRWPIVRPRALSAGLTHQR